MTDTEPSTFWKIAAAAGNVDAGHLIANPALTCAALGSLSHYSSTDPVPTTLTQAALTLALRAGRRHIDTGNNTQRFTGLDVARILALAPTTTTEQISTLVKKFRTDEPLAEHAAQHPNTNTALLGRLSARWEDLNATVAAHPNTSTALRRRLWATNVDVRGDNRHIGAAWAATPPPRRHRILARLTDDTTNVTVAAGMWPIVAANATQTQQRDILARILTQLQASYRIRALLSDVSAATDSRCVDAINAMIPPTDADIDDVIATLSAGGRGRTVADTIATNPEWLLNFDRDDDGRGNTVRHRFVQRITRQLDQVTQQRVRDVLRHSDLCPAVLAHYDTSELADIAGDTNLTAWTRLRAVDHIANTANTDRSHTQAAWNTLTELEADDASSHTVTNRTWERLISALGHELLRDAPAAVVAAMNSVELIEAAGDMLPAGTSAHAAVYLTGDPADFTGTFGDLIDCLTAFAEQPRSLGQ